MIDAATEAVSWLKEMFQSKEEVFENGVFEDVEPEEEEPEDDEEIDEDQSEEEAKPEDDNEEVNSEDKDKKKKKAEERKSKASKEDSNIANEQSQSESKAEQGNEDEREATRDGNDQSRANHDETSYIPDAYQQTETTDNKVGKPLVEIFARHVDGTFGTLEHSYTIFTDSKGHRTIITGFPEKNSIVGMLFYNLKVVDCPYTEENKRLFGDDWESKEVKRWSVDKFNLENDAELQDHLLKARTAVKFIETGNNGGRFDYDLCITDNCSGGNSNTVQKVIWNAMGREIKVQKGIDLPGINGKFYDGPLDDPMRKFGEEIQKEQP